MKISTRQNYRGQNTQIPSRFQLGDRVKANTYVGEITGIIFTEHKVHYDIVTDSGQRLFRVDSAIITPVACGSSKAPAGWDCSRGLGHEGPCAASPIEPRVKSRVETMLDQIRARGRAIRDTNLCKEIVLPTKGDV